MGGMIMLTRILFLADVSPFSERALAWASEKLKGQQTDFLVLHVVDPAAGMEAPHVVREAEGYLEEMAARVLPPESYYKTLVLSGDILESLPETVRSEGCTFALLALPERVDGLPLIRSIPVPQLVIRESEGQLPDTGVFGKLALALDLEPNRTSLMLDNLRAMLSATGTSPEIVLVHGVSPVSAEEAPAMLNAAEEALEEIRDEIASWGLEVSTSLLAGDPATDLPGRIEELAPTALAIGLPAAGELGRLVPGSVAEGLIESTRCPLVVFPL
jgi:nucleotide-binding universal stress UspA family protein